MLAEGRDTEIVDLGGGRVLRRPKVRRDLSRELVAMQAAAAAGYPTVRAHEVRDDGLVLDRLDGIDMLTDVGRHPTRLRRHGRTLADLHRRLAAVTAPASLPPTDGGGASLLHLDLHPGNVLLTDRGPVVIDWANAGRGHGGLDVANTWLLLAAAQPDDIGPIDRVVVALGRGVLLHAFLSVAGRRSAAAHLDAALTLQELDPNKSPEEVAAMEGVVRRNR